jgi:alkyl hydroperoxide reductase subunit AhpC
MKAANLEGDAMSLPLGSIAPDFVQDSSQGKIHFHEYIQGHWAVLFSHPADFTPVCTTELGETAKLKPEFDRRNARVLALSVDTSDSHTRWIPDINDTQKAEVDFPILADADRSVAALYGMLHPQSLDNQTVRSVFIIDPGKKVRLTLTYPASTGRNFKEILRVLDSLQLTDKHKVATPVNWQDGEDVVILPSIKDPAELERLFPKGYRAVRPYLRLTPQPNR